jgi:topoisomerase-4 subunit A
LKNKFLFIKEGEGNYLEAATTDEEPLLQVQSGRGEQLRRAKIKLKKVTEVMGWKAVGAKLTDYNKSVIMDWVKPEKTDEQPELF